MDSLTQACLGAAVGGTLLGRRLGRKAILVGAALGTLPDLDVVIDYGDAVADYTYHRGFSHSLFVLETLATGLALLCASGPRTRGIAFRHWWLFFSACLLTHPLLDAFTTYGTQLWWPLRVAPVSWHSIFIIDPLYTLPLLITLLIALSSGRVPGALPWGLTLSSAYLAFTLVAMSVVDARLAPVLADRGLLKAPRLVQPTPFNALLWRVTIIEGDDYYEGLVGLLDERPPSMTRFARGAALEAIALNTPAGQRLDWFAGPFLAYQRQAHADHETLIATDLRLGFPGYYPFRFALAERRASDSWQAIEAHRAPGERANGDSLRQLMRRIVSDRIPLCHAPSHQGIISCQRR
ncbi:metal-dependent hydrolase [Halomonas sp. WWR20]